ncbi:hypothetical protein HUJ04_011370 [Dendroctonus ponderosae]|nr:hypothetical protein HUJ04_011370 [Dendroctonus ponderosae]
MLVILREDNVPSSKWPMACIIKVMPGKDNKVSQPTTAQRACPAPARYTVNVDDQEVLGFQTEE